jgi:hypothetical protein
MNSTTVGRADFANPGWIPAQPPTDTVFLRRIDRGGTHWISRPQGRRVVCDSGALWLCFEGRGSEAALTLTPGQAHVCTWPGKVSIYALETGSFHLV